MGSGRRSIKVIGPVRGEEEEEKNKQQANANNNNKSKALVLGDKKYCPNDSSLLVFKPDTFDSLCTICGFIDGDSDGEDEDDNDESKLRPSIQKNMRGFGDGSNTISMDVLPMTEGRSIMKHHDNYSSDPDRQALIEKGYTIIDEYEAVSETGTYNAQQELEERERLQRFSSRNRFSTWSVY